jgi:uncharacterized protein (DUF305 family)
LETKVKKTIVALAFVASLAPLSATAQQDGTGTDPHHPDTIQSMPPKAPEAATNGMSMQPMMEGMPSMQGMGTGKMMNCPMMGRCMGGMEMDASKGDQSVASLALNAVNQRMHREMAISFSGNPDVDFVRAMIAHHQGAVDMAKVVKAFGSDATIGEMADSIIKAQEAEMTAMRAWLSRNVQQ